MLKLEKTPHLSGVTIRMRERERFFEPQLLKALTVALILHSGALFLFHVTPFYLSSTFTFPPIQVQADPPSQGVSAVVSPYIEEDEFLPPPLTLVPNLDWILFSQDSTLIPTANFDPHALQFLEEQVWPKWQESVLLGLEEPHIQLAISGDLAELPLLTTDSLLNQMQPISFSTTPMYVTYQVQLDEKTGELFWYERLESSALTEIDQLTEQILLHLRFATPLSKEPVKGVLSFVISPKESHD